MPITQTPYPIDALPDIIKNAITAYAEYGQQPISLLANSALSHVSLSCQGLANVARDDLLVSPISMYFITVASSGERKTAADKTFSRGIKAWEETTINQLMPQYERQKSAYLTWSVQRKATLAMIKKFTTQGFDVSELANVYHNIVMQQPEIPLLPKLKYEDITAEALSENLASKWPSASIFSDEAGIFLSSPSMQKDNTKFVALLNRLWDSEPIEVHRKTSQDVLIKHRRFTLNLMMQPLLLKQMLKKQEGINRHSGFLARVLLAYPDSNMGNRFYKTPISVTQPMRDFQERIKSSLEKTLPLDQSGFKHIPTLTFEKSAKAQWIEYFNHIEKAIGNPYQWECIHDIASKASENIARLSALFHLFTASTGTEISKNHVDRAYQIIEWYLNEAKRIFANPASLTQIEQDANLIIKTIIDKQVENITVRQLGKIVLVHQKDRRKDAIQWLEASGKIKIVNDGNRKLVVFDAKIKNESATFC